MNYSKNNMLLILCIVLVFYLIYVFVGDDFFSNNVDNSIEVDKSTESLSVYSGSIYQGTGLYELQAYLITENVHCDDLILNDCNGIDQSYELWYLVSEFNDNERIYLGYDLVREDLEDFINSGFATGRWFNFSVTDARERRLDNPQVDDWGLLSVFAL